MAETKNRNNSRKKQRRKLFRAIIITGILFFIIGFYTSYLVSINNTKKELADNNGSLEEVGDKEAPIEEEVPHPTETEGSSEKEPLPSEEKENEEESKTPTPTNPPAPNVEKLNIEELEKLKNDRLSWWIRLNKEHKPPTTNEEIDALIEKYDGIYLGDTSEKAIYLTIDEGYENGYTPQILDTLKDNDVKTIFFVTSSYIKNNPELVRRMLDEGHQVGNHTISHPSLPSLDYEKLEHEMLGLEKEFFEMFQAGFKYMRPPSGEYSERVLAAAKQLGYKTVFWSFAYDDWHTDKIRGADYAYNIVMENLHNGAVILLHAVSKDNTEALDRIIKDIRAKGYEIKPFDL